jgi:hypothetical protein
VPGRAAGGFRSAALAVVLAPGVAQGYVRTRTEDGSAVVRWLGARPVVVIVPSSEYPSQDLSRQQVEQALRLAADSWTSVPCAPTSNTASVRTSSTRSTGA